MMVAWTSEESFVAYFAARVSARQSTTAALLRLRQEQKAEVEYFLFLIVL